MKTTTLLTLSIAAGSVLALTARADIEGTYHDFSLQSWNTISQNPSDPATVCGVCHTPHHANQDQTGGPSVPLWGHATSAQSFTLYTSPTLLAQQQPLAGSPSLACLSCHDGQTAVNTFISFGTMKSFTPAQYVTAAQANLGVNLSHTHPIAISYTAALVGTSPGQDKWLQLPTASILVPASGNFVPANDNSIETTLLNGGTTVECTSCHDVHNQVGTPFDLTYNKALVKIVGTDANGRGSLLCRSCHIK